jgi:DNA-binding MarR family transcriptional regulator
MTLRAAASTDADDVLAELQGHLHLAFARMRTAWKDAAARIHADLSPAGYKLLSFIARTGSANAHQIAETFGMDKSFVSRQVRMLEDFGLVQSRPDENDGRLRVLTATPEACEALAEVRADHTVWLRTALPRLSAEELRAASKAFQVLSEV